MTVLGNTSSPTSGFNQSSTWNQVSPKSNQLITPGQIIRVTKLWAYFGGTSGTVSGCKLCIWGTGNSLLYSSQTFTAPHGRQWVSVVPSTTLLLNPSTSCYVGWWAPSGSNMEWGVRSSGHWQAKQNQSSVSSMSGSSQDPFGVAGEAGGYLEYTPAGGLGLAASGSFTKYALRRYDGSAWNWYALKKWSGSAWEWYA